MLVDLSGPRTVLDPRGYPGSLAVRLDTGNRPDCGVVSGNGSAFRDGESDQPVPRRSVLDPDEHVSFDDLGIFDYVIDRPCRVARPHEVLMYHYVATGWKSGVYYEHPAPTVLVLQETSTEFRVSLCGLDVVLPDYEPGRSGSPLP